MPPKATTPPPPKAKKATFASTPRHQRTVAVGGALQGVLGYGAGAEVAVLARLLPHWSTVVPGLHRYCWPLGLSRGTLTIGVASSSVQQQLHYELPAILQLISMVMGPGTATKVRFQLSAPPPRMAVAAPAPAPASPTLDMAAALCKTVPDAELRQALAQLGSHVLASRRKA